MNHLKKIKLYFFLILISSLTIAQTEEINPFKVKELSKRVVVITEDSSMENNFIAIASRKGLVVVDTSGSPFTAAQIKKTIEEYWGRKDFIYVINTHHHWDHSWGNQAFDGAEIIGHEWCLTDMPKSAEVGSIFAQRSATRIKKMKEKLKNLKTSSKEAKETSRQIAFSNRLYRGLKDGFTITRPTITFNDRLILNLGDLTLKLYYFGRAHSRSDILIHLPEEGIILTGDLFLERGWLPLFAQYRELDIDRWIEVLNTVLNSKNQIKHVIPGHKDIWKPEKLVLWRDYIVKLWKGLVTAEKGGMNLEEAEKRFPLDKKFDYLKELGHSDTALSRFHTKNIRAFWRQLKEPAAFIVEKVILKSGIHAGINTYHKLKTQASNNIFFDELSFNDLGYKLLMQKKIKEAIEIFKLNVKAYPDSWNVYDSLGEAYMVSGDKKRAIKNYKKSVNLNPENKNAIEIIKRLKGKK